MALKALIENLEDVPEALRDQYSSDPQDVKIGGKTEKRHVLQIEGVREHPQVLSLQNAHERQKSENQTLKGEMTTLKERIEGLPDDFDTEKYVALKAAAEGKGNATEEQLATVREATRTDLRKKELEPLKQRNEVLQREIHRVTVDDGLTKALVEAGVAKEFLGAARAFIKDKGSIKLNEKDGKFEPLAETDMGPQSLAEFAGMWAQSDEGKPFVAKANGSGAEGSHQRRGEGNPFTKKEGTRPNLTAINDAIKADTGKARDMAKSAGWTPQEMSQVGLSVQ
jgi:cell division protein FtsB